MFLPITFIDAILGITALVTFVLMLLVYLRDKDNPVNVSFAIFLLTIIIWPIVIAGFRLTTNTQLAYIFDYLIYGVGIFTPGSWLFFAYSFCAHKFPPKKEVLISIIPIIIIECLLFFTPTFIKNISVYGYHKDVQLGFSYIIWSTYYAIYMTYGLILLFKKFFASTGFIKIQSLYIAISIIIPTICAIPTNVVMPLLGNYDHIYLGPIILSITNIIIAYAIAKHRFFDIRPLAIRSIIFSFLLMSFGGIWAIIIDSVFNLFVILNRPQRAIAATIMSFIAIIAFRYFRIFLERTTQRWLFKDRYDPQQLMQIVSRVTASSIDLDTITKQALMLICRNIHIVTGCFIVHTPSIQKITCFPDPNSYLSPPDLDLLSNVKDVTLFDEILESPLKECMRTHHASIIIPLVTNYETIGHLVLGDKASGDAYYESDIQFFHSISPELAIAINNALSYEQIRNFNEKLQAEINKATAELKRTNRHLVHLDQLKDEFLFIATHELKNPIVVIKGYVSMISTKHFGEVPDYLQKPIEQMQLCTQQLIELTNDLLQIARTESQSVKLNISTINLTENITQITNNLQPLAIQKQLILNSKLPENPISVQADPLRLKEILNNLIGNSIKYSDSGTITISATTSEKQAVVSIEDEGCGISPEDQKKLFTRFFRANEQTSKGIPGTGLGLYITKQYIEQMHGQIWVTSTPGQGTTFSFSLPLS